MDIPAFDHLIKAIISLEQNAILIVFVLIARLRGIVQQCKNNDVKMSM